MWGSNVCFKKAHAVPISAWHPLEDPITERYLQYLRKIWNGEENLLIPRKKKKCLCDEKNAKRAICAVDPFIFLKFLARLKEPHMILTELMYIYFKLEYPCSSYD
jgi:hypothetical protein